MWEKPSVHCALACSDENAYWALLKGCGLHAVVCGVIFIPLHSLHCGTFHDTSGWPPLWFTLFGVQVMLGRISKLCEPSVPEFALRGKRRIASSPAPSLSLLNVGRSSGIPSCRPLSGLARSAVVTLIAPGFPSCRGSNFFVQNVKVLFSSPMPVRRGRSCSYRGFS